jgi:short-subunit dehydrogenase involved in D-alanine esterification of teichoic acids
MYPIYVAPVLFLFVLKKQIAFSVVVQRFQLAPLGIRVVEMIPPMVESELNTEGRRRRNVLSSPFMVSSDEYVEKTMAKMEQDIDEIRWEMTNHGIQRDVSLRLT